MKYYTYNINTGWTSGTQEPESLIAGYVNADNEVALDLWIEKSINIPASNTNVFQLQVDTDDLTSWQDYDVKIYYTLPSYVGHSAPLINDTNGHNWEEYISKPTLASQHSYYLNIRAQEIKKEFNFSLINSISYVNATYRITYKWTDSSGIQQEHSQYQSGTSENFTPVDEGYPAIGYNMNWGIINNYIYNGLFIAENLPYRVYRGYSIQGNFKESDDPISTENAQYGDIVYFNEPQLYEYTWTEGTPEKSYTQRAEFSHVEMQELDSDDNILSTSIIANISRFEYICKNTNEATTQIKFIVVYKEPITFTIDYKLPRNSSVVNDIALPTTSYYTPEYTLNGITVTTEVVTNSSSNCSISSTGEWNFKYLSSNRVIATPKWNITLNLPFKNPTTQTNPYIITISNPEEPFYLCPNCYNGNNGKDTRVEYYTIYGTNYSPYFPYTLYDFKLWEVPNDTNHFSLNVNDTSGENNKVIFLSDTAQPWPYFIYDEYKRPVPILDIMVV